MTNSITIPKNLIKEIDNKNCRRQTSATKDEGGKN